MLSQEVTFDAILEIEMRPINVSYGLLNRMRKLIVRDDIVDLIIMKLITIF